MSCTPATPFTIDGSWRRILFPILTGFAIAITLQMNHFAWLNQIELPIHQFLNGLCGRAAWFDRTIIFLNDTGGELLFVMIAFAGYCLIARHRARPGFSTTRLLVFAGYILAFWMMTNMAGEVLAPWFGRGSYSQHLADGLINLNAIHGSDIKIETDHAFPSNHGIVFFMLFFMCLWRFGRMAWWLLPLCILLSVPRVFTGAHWLTDTLIGSVWLAWIFSAIAFTPPLARLLEWVETRFEPSKEPAHHPPPPAIKG